MGLSEYIELPYYCDDCHTWHKSLYDESEGEIWECDADGNWELSLSDSLPTDQEQDRAWLEYAEWVYENGKDPLEDFSRSENKQVFEKWTFQIFESKSGLIVNTGRKYGDANLPAEKLPKHVMEYLELDPDKPLDHLLTVAKDYGELKSILKPPDTIKPWPHLVGFYLLSCVIGRWITIEPTKNQIRESARKAIKIWTTHQVTI